MARTSSLVRTWPLVVPLRRVRLLSRFAERLPRFPSRFLAAPDY